MNLKNLAHKLQTALCLRGDPVKINQVQFYNPNKKSIGTKYIVVKPEVIRGRTKNTTILETYQLADVVKTLATLYGGDGG